MKHFLKKILPGSGGDSWVIIETRQSCLRVIFAEVQPKTKRLIIQKQLEVDLEDPSLDAYRATVSDVFKKISPISPAKVAVILDHSQAVELSGNISLMRSDCNSEITRSEFDDLVSRGIWKLLMQQRVAAAKQLLEQEIDIRLIDADIIQVLLDGHRVVNPIGFTARTIEFTCSQTFISKALFNFFSSLLTDDNLALVVEGAALLTSSIKGEMAGGDFLFASIGSKRTVLYEVEGVAVRYLDSFELGRDSLFNSLTAEVGVDSYVASQILNKYKEKDLSNTMKRLVERAISGELAMLSNGIAAHQKNKNIPVYVHAEESLPSCLFVKEFIRRLGLSLKLTEVNEEFVGKRSGFGVQFKHSRISSALSGYEIVIATLANWYDGETAQLRKTASQRARWIQSGQ